MSKKRFDKLEGPGGTQPPPKTFLDHFRFKRKLEVEGQPREAERAKPPASRPMAPPQTQQRLQNTKHELSTMADEIAAAEERKRQRAAQQTTIRTNEINKTGVEVSYDMAKERASSARNRIFLAVIGIALGGALFYFTTLNQRSFGGVFEEVVFLVFFILAAVLGRGGRWRRRRW